MGMKKDSFGAWNWTYVLEDGNCEDSMALQTAKLYGLPDSLLLRAAELASEFDKLRQNPVKVKAVTQKVIPMIKSESEIVIKAAREYTLEEIIPIASKLMQLPEPPSILDGDWQPPIALEGHSCVYILHISNFLSFREEQKITSDKVDLFYVGETESINQRMNQHRKKWKGCIVRAILTPVENKSRARMIETSLIIGLKAQGYKLANDELRGDGAHILFGEQI